MKTSRLWASVLIAAAMAGAAPALAGPDFFPDSSYVIIPDHYLQDLDCYGLWHARNEIYARNGYHFKTRRAQAEFGTSGWTSNPRLNQVEQHNIARVQAFERANYCN